MSKKAGQDLKSFPATKWSLVARAGLATPRERRLALGALLQRYQPALRAHLLLAKRLPHDQVEDLLQGFITDQVVEQNLVAHAQQQKGKFRSFLLLALHRYLITQLRREHSRQRTPENGVLLPLNEEAMNVPDRVDPCDHFDRAWARELVGETLRQMRLECDGCGRQDIWGVFEGRMVGPLLQSTSPQPYDHLAECYGVRKSQAANLLITGKRMFARLLRAGVQEYVADDREIDEEIGELLAKLGGART
jgi:RNA polymerase sigma-70 factor (ECF subfamily)